MKKVLFVGNEFLKKLLYLNLQLSFEQKAWDEEKHPRVSAGNSKGGQFTDSLLTYQGVSFDSVNNELRYDKPDKYKKVISDLDKAATDVTDETLYRGLDADFTKELVNKYKISDPSNIDELKQKLIGQTITDKSFMSTSRDLNVAGDFARDKGKGRTTVLQIGGKKTGIDVSKHLNNFKSSKEKEFIIRRGSKLKITNVSISKTGKIILYTEIQ